MAKSAILVALEAAGLRGRQGKRYRPLAEIEADVEKAKATLAAFVWERKRAMASEKAKRQHQDPAYIEKFRAGRAALYSDPKRLAEWQAKIHTAALANGWYLPPMSKEQKLAYNRLLRKGVPRHDALPVALA
jgi:hypothetical protein